MTELSPKGALRHHWIIRWTHWVAVVAILIMAGSGMRVFNAYPAFHRKGGTFCCYPFEGHPIPAWLDLWRVARWRPELAFRDDVGVARERADLPRIRLPARRMARPRPAARRSAR